MWPGDNAEKAQKSAQILDDSRVRHFHDPRATHLAGKAFAKGLIREGDGPAWDIYMFYKRGMMWDEGPPMPVKYMHQLGGGSRADPEHFHTGEDLMNALHEAMHKVTGEDCALPEP